MEKNANSCPILTRLPTIMKIVNALLTLLETTVTI